MKTTILILVAAFLALSAAAQITNGVKISAISSASTPLTGNEVVPMNQGGVTHTATVNQILASAVSQILLTTNGLASLLQSEIANRTGGDSNSLAYATNVLNQTIAAIVATNSAILVELGLTNNTLLSAIQGTNSAIVTALGATNTVLLNALGATNTALRTAIATSNFVVNGTSPTLSTLTLTNEAFSSQSLGTLTIPTVAGNTWTTNLDLSQGTIRYATLSPANSGNEIFFMPTNVVDGQNVYVYLTVTGGTGAYVGIVPPATGGPWTVWYAGGYATNPTNGKKYFGAASGPLTATAPAVINIQVIGQNIFFSYGLITQ